MTREQPDRLTREIQEEVNKEFGPDVTRAGYGACTLRRRKLRISASNTARRSIGPKPLLNRSTIQVSKNLQPDRHTNLNLRYAESTQPASEQSGRS